MDTPATPGPGHRAPADPASALDFTDPLSRPSGDDTDRGWGERTDTAGGDAADLARFLEEKPPHHL
ncbi:hypothetical protein V1L54_03215 [Streptomyces sp. TRM 70361]|uniref:hypothetical protein n=1 Tax=Streptomyces sp. TRM 70361 TaxID=3116553 RepID=UPI002E7BA42E|nr:hypothetical protein [Streptomyces sp. TRM 70361]MEE1938431.1 hypothetical protein [Streptomyces sp. TRM 70361]